MKILKYTLVLSLIFCCFLATAQNPHAESGLKKVIVKEVLQVSSYTYLRVLEEDQTEKWLAVPTMEAKAEEVYYYQGGVEMPDFESSELNRKFDVVLFLGYITSADTVDPEKGIIDPNAVVEEAKPAKKATLEKLELSIDGIEGGIRIAEFLADDAVIRSCLCEDRANGLFGLAVGGGDGRCVRFTVNLDGLAEIAADHRAAGIGQPAGQFYKVNRTGVSHWGGHARSLVQIVIV